MIIDVPDWVCHGHSDGISAVDVHPSGRRLVTCGSSPQIKIWNLLPILDPAAEKDPNVPKLLAMLSEHQSDAGVQIARFNHSGSILASGGSDNIVLLYKLSAAPATAMLGSKWVNKENWRAVGNLRGPSLDITGLSWSKDDKQLATCSMDGSIHTYNITAEGHGNAVHTIRNQHHGWVKGVAFDPVGRYLASHGRNGVKVWDLQKDWALAHHMKQQFEKAPESAFRLSISWAPDGDLLIAPNGSNNGKPTTCVFKRQDWDANNLVGHRSSVIAAVANPRLFYPSKALLAARQRLVQRMQAEAEGRDPDDDANGDATAADAADEEGYDEDTLMSILACGSNDKTYTVWGTESSLPMISVSQLHTGPVHDFCWTPDGYTLIAASGDDSISVVRFSEKELGKALTDAQFEAHMQKEYGGAAAIAAASDASAAQDPELAMLAAAAPLVSAAAATTVAAPQRRVAPQPVGAAAAAGTSGNGMLDRRIMPTGPGVTTGTMQQQQTSGKKRLHPAPVHPAAANGLSSKRQALGSADGAQQQQQQQPQTVRSLGRPAAGRWPLGIPAVVSLLQCQAAVVSSGVVLLSAQNSGSGSAAVADVWVSVTASVTQAAQPERIWQDKVQGQVVAIAGTAFYTAAATATGLLHIWRPGGNTLLPPLVLGCPPVSLAAHGDWQLQVVGADGDFYLLDFSSGSRIMGPNPPANITPLLTASPPGTTLREAWISGTTPPQQQQQQLVMATAHVATLTDGSGWIFHQKLGLWMQLQPGVHERNYVQLPRVGATGVSADAEKLRDAASHAAARRPLAPTSAAPPIFRRKGAEQQLHAAFLLAEPGEYQRWLGFTVTALCETKEHGRLMELTQDFMGPDRWTPAMGDVPWSPTVLGLDKRQLLGSIVIPAMAGFGLQLAARIRNQLVLARQHVDQYNQRQQQQQQQPMLGVQRLAPQMLSMGMPSAPQQMMQVFQQQQQAGYHHQQQQQQQQQQAMPPPGLVNGYGAPPMDGSAGLHAQQQQQQQLEGSGSGHPPAAASGTGVRAAAAAAPMVVAAVAPRRIQPQAVDDTPQQQQQAPADVDMAAGSTAGRQPLQQVSLGQQQMSVAQQQQQQQQQQQTDKPGSQTHSGAIEGAQGEQQA